MRSISATLVALFGIYIIWGATGYVFDASPTQGSKPYFWAVGVAAFGAALVAASKKLGYWFNEGLTEHTSDDGSLSVVLYRLFGLYVLYSQVPEFAQWFFVLTGVDVRASYAQMSPEFTNYALWKMFLQLAIIFAAIFLALVPKKVDRWLSKFDLK
jgi:hypothetical protein